MKTVFTTGEAAKICKVSQQTVIRCFDSGQLKGFRVPGSRFRRIPREHLFAFMRENGIPTDALESGKRKILVVDDDVEFCRMLPERFGVAAIPVSAFYRERRMGRHLVRFAFCKRTEVLERAGERLQTLRRVLG